MVLSRNKAAEVLGVALSAPDEEVTAAYRRLALKCHPDQSPSPNAKGRFQQVGQAYKRLCPECRDMDTSDSEDEDDYGEGEMFDIFNLVMQREFHRIRTRFQGTDTSLGRMMQDPGFSRDWIKLFHAYDDLMQRGDVEEGHAEDEEDDDYSDEEGYDPEYDGRYWSDDSEADEDWERRLKDARAGIGEPEERIKAEWKRKMELRRLRYVHEERKLMKNSHKSVAQKDDEEARRRADEVARELLEEEEREKSLASGKSKGKKAKGTGEGHGKAAQSSAYESRDEDAQDEDDAGDPSKGKKLTKAEKKKRQEERKAEQQKLKKAEKRAIQKQRKKDEKEGNEDEKTESGDDFDEDSAFVAMFAAKKGKPGEAAAPVKAGSTVLAGKGVVLIPDASIENQAAPAPDAGHATVAPVEVSSVRHKMESLKTNGAPKMFGNSAAPGLHEERNGIASLESAGKSPDPSSSPDSVSRSLRTGEQSTGTKASPKPPQVAPANAQIQGPSHELPDAYIHEQIRLRKVARERKDFKNADAIRDAMLAKGVLLEDRGRLTTFKRIDPTVPHIPDPARARNRENRHDANSIEESASVNSEVSKPAESLDRKFKTRPIKADSDAARCEIFVGNVRKDLPLPLLKKALSEYGEIAGDIRPQPKSSSVLATFETFEQAMAAIKGLNGQVIGRARSAVVIKMSYNNPPSIIQAFKHLTGTVGGTSGSEQGSTSSSPARGGSAISGKLEEHPQMNGNEAIFKGPIPQPRHGQIDHRDGFGKVPNTEPSIRVPSPGGNVSSTHSQMFGQFDHIPVDGDMDMKSVDSEGSENESMKSRYQRSLMGKALLAFDSYALSEQEKMAGIQRAINSPKTATIFEKWRRLPSLSELRDESDGYDREMSSNSNMSRLGAIGQRKGATRSHLDTHPEQAFEEHDNHRSEPMQGVRTEDFGAPPGSDYLAAQKMHQQHAAVRSNPQTQWEDTSGLGGMSGARGIQQRQQRQMGIEMNASQQFAPGAGVFSSQAQGQTQPYPASQNGSIGARHASAFAGSSGPGGNAGYFGQMTQGYNQGFGPVMPGPYTQRIPRHTPTGAPDMGFQSHALSSSVSHGFPSDPMSMADQSRLAAQQQQPRQPVQWSAGGQVAEPNWSVGPYQNQNEEQWMQQPVPMYQHQQQQWMQHGYQQQYNMGYGGGRGVNSNGQMIQDDVAAGGMQQQAQKFRLQP